MSSNTYHSNFLKTRKYCDPISLGCGATHKQYPPGRAAHTYVSVCHIARRDVIRQCMRAHVKAARLLVTFLAPACVCAAGAHNITDTLLITKQSVCTHYWIHSLPPYTSTIRELFQETFPGGSVPITCTYFIYNRLTTVPRISWRPCSTSLAVLVDSATALCFDES